MKMNHPSESSPGQSEHTTRGQDFGAELAAGVTLEEYMGRQKCVDPDLFVLLARSIAACILKLHLKQTLHLDLRPERIGLFPGKNETFLVDSGVAVQCSESGYALPQDFSVSEAILPYCPPELTGRMLRTVDERSDLYSLGVIFYKMLTGRLPFTADDPLEWEYMHLAQTPPPLASQGAELPEGLSAIVMKLLEKNPDNRYQNAGFLIQDLDKIGDSQGTFLMKPGLHGREYEMSMLTQAFYSTCFGSTEMVYISGEAGIGKTSLMDEMFRKQQHAQDFFYITGKFEQLSMESPYHPIIQAFRGLMRHLLGLRIDRSEEWKTKLQNALGSNANVITAIIPEAGLLLGNTPAAEELQASESKKRFIYAFRKFVQALASKEQPLVLFIDDLQWANSSSLQLLHALLSDPESQYLMIVCAYRHTETDETRLPGYEPDGNVTDQAVVRRIHLSPLSLEQMNRIVMEMLYSSEDTTLPLTELLYHRSGGNPFHFKQILLRLQDDRLLAYNHETRSWQWHLGQIIDQEPNFSIHDLIEHKLRRLSPEAQRLLEIAACVGSAFDPQLIACAFKGKTETVTEDWSAIESEGMIVPMEADRFRFAHDNIQKLIYGRIADGSKQDIHLRIGKCLDGDNRWNESDFDAVNHLNLGSGKMTDKQEIRHLIEMNLNAGNRAKASSAHDVALAYFSKGVELLTTEDWNQMFDLSFELHAQKAECQYLCGNSEECSREIDFLLGIARNPVERSRVQMIRIMKYINQGRYLEGTALGLERLREHRIIISPHPGKFMLMIEGMRIEMLLRGRYDKLAQLKEMSDQERIAVMNLIFAITPSTFFTDKKIFFLLMCRAIQLSLKYGNTPVSAAVYSSIGMVLGQAMNKFDKGYALGKIGVELSEKYDIASIKSKTYTIFGGVLCQFAGNASEGDAYLDKALRFGMESGDYVFASYAMGAHVNSLYIRAPLSELARTIADYMTVLDTTNDEFVRQNFYLYQRYILALQGKTAAPDSFNGNGFEEEEFLNRISREETSATTLFQYSTYKTQLCYLAGRHHEAIRWAKEAESYEAYATHLPHLPECLFYESLAITASYPDLRQETGMRKKVIGNLRRFRKWAAWSLKNYHSRLILLEAEYAYANGDWDKAEEMYDKAIREAREHGDIQVASIACERAANHFLKRDQRKSALHYLHSAVEGYSHWELNMKIAELEERMENLQNPANTGRATENGQAETVPIAPEQAHGAALLPSPPPSSGVDFAAILKKMQSAANPMDMDAVLTEIMNNIMKYAGASKGALLATSHDTLVVQAYADSKTQIITSPSELSNSALLPEGIIRYVYRTGEDVQYTGGEESWLIHNPYIALNHPQSVLCTPVIVHGIMLGILYLENKLAQGVFTKARMELPLTLASHGILMCVLQSFAEQAAADPDTDEETAPVPGHMEEPLTDRELEVLALLAAGLSNKEIADQLIIAVGTVKVHVKNIFAKLKVNRRTKAIAQAKELKLLDQTSKP
ncbi:helix-turn-helix transcriptional regulator [Paenibacillus azoreducens]|uniref:Serine/threonine protein kinase n=2 Tax=Paenibacillus azoreducens TaxID=116718 RepID=A0A920CPA2_9BACL|nr:AAA family ATPase [Paenibacillus azoreducens]GIO48416.1 serine/threonine protein kinase [Paenibacillus azoreducens]